MNKGELTLEKISVSETWIYNNEHYKNETELSKTVKKCIYTLANYYDNDQSKVYIEYLYNYTTCNPIGVVGDVLVYEENGIKKQFGPTCFNFK